MAEAKDDRDAVLAALDRLTAWSEMARSPQLTRFLDYIVRRRLDGDTQSIKAYSIAVDVFGRPPDFDPQSDPIVRVQARRLRALLDQYYRGPGASERLQIVLPVGRYVPDFVAVDADMATLSRPAQRFAFHSADQDIQPDEAPKPNKRGHVTVSWVVLLIIAVGAAALAYSLSTWGPRRENQAAQNGALQRPSLRIMEFQNLTGDSTITAPISALGVELVMDFMPFMLVDAAYGGRGEIATQADQFDGFVLTGIVRQDPVTAEDYQISAILTDLLSNSVVWNWTKSVPHAELTRPGTVDFISRDLLSVLGGTRGPLHARARALLANSSIVGKENFYLCSVLFSVYRTTPTIGTAERVKACIAALPQRDRDDGNTMAALASLTAETLDLGQVTTAQRLERLGTANELIAGAIRVAPTSSFVWEQRARINEVMGSHDLAEAAYGTALQLNPANMDAQAAHARHLALIGRLDEAIPGAEIAIKSVPFTDIPGWYYCVPTLAALRTADYAKAARYAESCARADTELGPILAVLAAQGRGNREEVALELPRVLETPSFRNAGIITQLRRRVTDEVLLETIRASLAAAGVPPLSLVTAY